MKVTSKVTIDEVDNLLKNIRAITEKQVLIGIPEAEDARNDGSETNAAIGFINEYGSPARNIPARPFLNPGVADAMPEALKTLEKFAAKGLEDPDAVDKGLHAAGAIAVSAVKMRIRGSVDMAPLSERTLRERAESGYKGTKPLIRTGQLLNSITYVVAGKNGKD